MEPQKDCALCPRLVEYREENAADEPDWFNGAVPSFGDENGRLMIVGLAPGRTGANKTGRPFTGDYAGDLLYATLLKFGFAEGTYDMRPDDGLVLKDTLITNAVRCAPPANKPTTAEINACRTFLSERLTSSPSLMAVLCLGRIAHDSVVRACGLKLASVPFAHAAQHNIPGAGFTVFDSYHCSRYNTNTGRLTTPMFEDVFTLIQRHLA